MAASFTYSMFTAFGVILIGVGLALQVLYIEQEINKQDNSYLPMQIASILINSLVVVYLLISITFYRPYQSNFGLFGSITILLLGLVGEIYLTNFGESDVGKGFAYTFAGINALTRLYLLIAVRCDSYLTTIPELIKQLSKEVKNSGQSVDSVARAVKADLGAQSSDVPDPIQTWNRVQSMVGADLKKIPDPELAKSIKDQIQKALGVPPREPRGGRR
jgi:hypothetical protein|uniref:Uncharacterized protein n=1 Tax=viral metagenome TaxID=1070528 RepID=A0A6C0LAK9_9ZZZZ